LFCDSAAALFLAYLKKNFLVFFTFGTVIEDFLLFAFLHFLVVGLVR